MESRFVEAVLKCVNQIFTILIMGGATVHDKEFQDWAYYFFGRHASPQDEDKERTKSILRYLGFTEDEAVTLLEHFPVFSQPRHPTTTRKGDDGPSGSQIKAAHKALKTMISQGRFVVSRPYIENFISRTGITPWQPQFTYASYNDELYANIDRRTGTLLLRYALKRLGPGATAQQIKDFILNIGLAPYKDDDESHVNRLLESSGLSNMAGPSTANSLATERQSLQDRHSGSSVSGVPSWADSKPPFATQASGPPERGFELIARESLLRHARKGSGRHQPPSRSARGSSRSGRQWSSHYRTSQVRMRN